MKKTTIIGKKQILTFTMILALSAAVWMNVKFATNGSDFTATSSIPDAQLGDTKYVAATPETEKEDYFSEAQSKREESREEQIEILEKTAKDVKSSDQAKISVAEEISKITNRMEMEKSIETLIEAKGFSDVLAVLSDEDCSIVIKAKDDIEKDETVQILDIVNSVAKINFENIKIVSVK